MGKADPSSRENDSLSAIFRLALARSSHRIRMRTEARRNVVSVFWTSACAVNLKHRTKVEILKNNEKMAEKLTSEKLAFFIKKVPFHRGVINCSCAVKMGQLKTNVQCTMYIVHCTLYIVKNHPC